MNHIFAGSSSCAICIIAGNEGCMTDYCAAFFGFAFICFGGWKASHGGLLRLRFFSIQEKLHSIAPLAIILTAE